jgi:hypothetical protein
MFCLMQKGSENTPTQAAEPQGQKPGHQAWQSPEGKKRTKNTETKVKENILGQAMARVGRHSPAPTGLWVQSPVLKKTPYISFRIKILWILVGNYHLPVFKPF